MNFNELFEGSFRSAYQYYVRAYRPNENRSIVRKISSDFECYEPNEAGNFRSIHNGKRYAKFKTSKNAFNYIHVSPVDLVIRDDFKNKFNLKPRIGYLDIETRVGTVVEGFPSPAKAVEPICLIQYLDSQTDTVFIFGDKDFYYKEHYLSLPNHQGKEVHYIRCKNETEIFTKFFKLYQRLKPAVVYAWNGEGFDFPYLYKRCFRLGLDVTNFSPFFGEISINASDIKLEEFDGDFYSASLRVPGVQFIDMLRLYKKIVLKPKVSYSLMSIATEEIGAKKITYDEFKTFDDFYQGNYTCPANPTDEQKTLCFKLFMNGAPKEEVQKAGYGQFVYYGVIDVVLLKGVDEKVGLTNLMAMVAQKMSSQYGDIMGTTRPWKNAIVNELYTQGKIIDERLDIDLDKPVYGGYVKEPVKGKHRWVLSADVNSMYPILSIAGSNMSPDTFRNHKEVPKDLMDFVKTHLKAGVNLEEQNENNFLKLLKDETKIKELVSMLRKYNLAMAPNSTFYDRTHQGFIPKMVNSIYTERKVAKGEMLDAEQALQLVIDRMSHLK